jgi:hypothetical protein
VILAEHRSRETWSHTSTLCAVVVNLVAKEKVKPEIFNPYTAPQKVEKTLPGEISMLKVFLK